MALKSQYYIPKTFESETHRIEETLNSEERVNEALEALFRGNWIIWEQMLQHERNLTIMVHGPSSPIDVRRLPQNHENALPLTGARGEVLRLDDQGCTLGLLPCRSLGTFWLEDYVNRTFNDIGIPNRIMGETIKRLSLQYRGYGAFQPRHLGKFNPDEGINPALFSLAVALKIKKEIMEHYHTGRVCIVCHPDQFYFIGNGSVAGMRDAALVLGEFYNYLNMELCVENILFNNPIFKKNFGWMEDPNLLAEYIIGDNQKVGLCLDCEHLERMGYSGQEIDVLFRNLVEKGVVKALHVDATHSVSQIGRPYILTAYQHAIPIAYEPRSAI